MLLSIPSASNCSAAWLPGRLDCRVGLVALAMASVLHVAAMSPWLQLQTNRCNKEQPPQCVAAPYGREDPSHPGGGGGS